MTRAIAILAAALCVAPPWAAAQDPPSAPGTLVEVAKAEEARRKRVRKPAKVYTNSDLNIDNTASRPAPPAPAAPEIAEAASTAVPLVNLPGGAAPPVDSATVRDEAFWRTRIAAARTALERSQVMAEALQSRINALTTDFVNRDDPAQRAKIDLDRRAALAELERVRAEIVARQKAIGDLEEDGRRAGVPPGWLRPGV